MCPLARGSDVYLAMAVAFNPHTYESIYGFDVLDCVHNFFPELLYDDALFRDSMLLQWMRARVSTVFGAAYARAKTMYTMYQSAARRTAFDTWRTSAAPPAAAAAPPVAVPPPAAAAPPVVPTPSPGPLPGLRLQPIAHIRTAPNLDANDQRVLNALLGPLINANAVNNPRNGNDLLGPNLFTNILESMFPVPEESSIPTAAAIDAASTLHTTVPDDTVCPICQEHDSFGEPRPTEQWRRLNCTHVFHTACIGVWFERDSHCPVCRWDIRQRVHPSTTRSED